MIGRLHHMIVDCPDPTKLAAFWSAVLGLPVTYESPDFTERDRAVLRLLGPHLRQAYQDAELRRRARPELTARQWDLLRLVATGHTNIQIGRRLGISEGTVRKHLENIYGRLGVSSRTAAVTRAFPEQLAI